MGDVTKFPSGPSGPEEVKLGVAKLDGIPLGIVVLCVECGEPKHVPLHALTKARAPWWFNKHGGWRLSFIGGPQHKKLKRGTVPLWDGMALAAPVCAKCSPKIMPKELYDAAGKTLSEKPEPPICPACDGGNAEEDALKKLHERVAEEAAGEKKGPCDGKGGCHGGK